MWVDYWGGGGAKGMLPPLSKYWGGQPPSSYAYVINHTEYQMGKALIKMNRHATLTHNLCYDMRYSLAMTKGSAVRLACTNAQLVWPFAISTLDEALGRLYGCTDHAEHSLAADSFSTLYLVLQLRVWKLLRWSNHQNPIK